MMLLPVTVSVYYSSLVQLM